ATAAQVVITSPSPGAFADGTLAATATAHAPGGVSGVRFELRAGDGSVLASANATQSTSDPATYAASIALAGVPDGAASLVAIESFAPQQSSSSAPVAVTVDQHPPTITLQTDGRTSFLTAGQTATVTAQIDDGAGSGVDPATVV